MRLSGILLFTDNLPAKSRSRSEYNGSNDILFFSAGPLLETYWNIKTNNEDLIPEEFLKIETADYFLQPTLTSADLQDFPTSQMTRSDSRGRLIICKDCGKSFSRIDSLKRHEKHYCGLKGERNICQFCGKRFSRSHILIGHMKAAHPSYSFCPSVENGS